MNKESNSKAFGESMEEWSMEYLKKKGLQIIHRNYRSRFGEIDLIALDKQQLIFIEVRYRCDRTHGTPAETVTVSKRKKLLSTARLYISNTPWVRSLSCRFDVFSVSSENGTLKAEWIRDAFGEN